MCALLGITLSACTGGAGGGYSSCNSGVKSPLLAGTCGSLSVSHVENQNAEAQSLLPAINYPILPGYFYDNDDDIAWVNAFTVSPFTGFQNLTGSVDDGTVLHYSILPDGNGHSVQITVTVSVNSQNQDITYLGTFDGVDNGYDGANYHYNYFSIVLHSDNTFDLQQIVFINEYIADETGAQAANAYGWQWYVPTTLTGGTISGSDIDATAISGNFESETLGGNIYSSNGEGVTSLHSYNFTIKSRGGIFGVQLSSYATSYYGAPLDLIGDKDMTTYNAILANSSNPAGPAANGYQYLLTDLSDGALYSDDIGNYPAWVLTWWADNP